MKIKGIMALSECKLLDLVTGYQLGWSADIDTLSCRVYYSQGAE